MGAPITKYVLTARIRGNTHEEIEQELRMLANGGYLLSSDYHQRDEFDSTGGRDRIVLEHTNPEQTPENYARELSEYVDGLRANRTPAPRLGGEREWEAG